MCVIEWSPALVDLAVKYMNEGVVGVDVAGDELKPMDGHLESFKVLNYTILYCTVLYVLYYREQERQVYI